MHFFQCGNDEISRDKIFTQSLTTCTISILFLPRYIIYKGDWKDMVLEYLSYAIYFIRILLRLARYADPREEK